MGLLSVWQARSTEVLILYNRRGDKQRCFEEIDLENCGRTSCVVEDHVPLKEKKGDRVMPSKRCTRSHLSTLASR